MVSGGGGGGRGKGGVAVASANAEEHSRSDVLNETKLGEERSAELACVKAAINQALLAERKISHATATCSCRHLRSHANKLFSVSRPFKYVYNSFTAGG